MTPEIIDFVGAVIGIPGIRTTAELKLLTALWRKDPIFGGIPVKFIRYEELVLASLPPTATLLTETVKAANAQNGSAKAAELAPILSGVASQLVLECFDAVARAAAKLGSPTMLTRSIVAVFGDRVPMASDDSWGRISEDERSIIEMQVLELLREKAYEGDLISIQLCFEAAQRCAEAYKSLRVFSSEAVSLSEVEFAGALCDLGDVFTRPYSEALRDREIAAYVNQKALDPPYTAALMARVLFGRKT